MSHTVGTLRHVTYWQNTEGNCFSLMDVLSQVFRILGFWALSVILDVSTKHRSVSETFFGFHPQVGGGRHLMCWVA
jgi:hypothetical protein